MQAGILLRVKEVPLMIMPGKQDCLVQAKMSGLSDFDADFEVWRSRRRAESKW